MQIKNRGSYALIVCIVTIIYLLASVLMTIEATSLDDNSVELICQTDTVILSGIEWKVYKVGELDSNGDYKLTGDFEDYSIEINNLSTSDMLNTAHTLETYALLDGISPMFNSITDDDGMVKFDSLESGLYLFSGDSKIIDDTKYIPSAMLIELISDDASVDLITYPKIVIKHVSYEDTLFTVKKIWSGDEDNLDYRPNSITVELYKDNVLSETVVLDDSNDWTYSWTSNTVVEWRVKETEIPKYYRVIYMDSEVQYLVMNIYDTKFGNGGDGHGDDTLTTTPYITEVTNTVSDTTNSTESSITSIDTSVDTNTTGSITESSTDTSDTTVTSIVSSDTTDTTTINGSGSTTTTTNSNDSKLPQTGQLWWPVPILSILGLVCIAISCRISIKK